MTKYIVWTLQNNPGLWPIFEFLLCSLHNSKCYFSYGFASAKHWGFSTSLRSVKKTAKRPWLFFRILSIPYSTYYNVHIQFQKWYFYLLINFTTIFENGAMVMLTFKLNEDQKRDQNKDQNKVIVLKLYLPDKMYFGLSD